MNPIDISQRLVEAADNLNQFSVGQDEAALMREAAKTIKELTDKAWLLELQCELYKEALHA